MSFDGRNLKLWQRTKKQDRIILDQAAPAGDRLFLRVQARQGHKFTFSTSIDGERWDAIAPESPLDGTYLPPWDRAIRVALTVGGHADATATFEALRIDSAPPRLQP